MFFLQARAHVPCNRGFSCGLFILFPFYGFHSMMPAFFKISVEWVPIIVFPPLGDRSSTLLRELFLRQVQLGSLVRGCQQDGDDGEMPLGPPFLVCLPFFDDFFVRHQLQELTIDGSVVGSKGASLMRVYSCVVSRECYVFFSVHVSLIYVVRTRVYGDSLF